MGICTSRKKADLDGWGVNCIVDDGDGNLFVSNYGKGLLILNTVTNTVATYSMNMENKKKGKLCNDWIKTMYYDSKGLLWIGCSDGISCLNVETGDFKPFGWNILLEGYQCMRWIMATCFSVLIPDFIYMTRKVARCSCSQTLKYYKTNPFIL